MNHQYYDLGYRVSNTTVRIELSGNSANVRLLDATNYQRFRTGKQYHYVGGHARRSPVDLQTTHSGHWYVVIDRVGYPAARVTSSVSVLG